jgi:hypothetical protein
MTVTAAGFRRAIRIGVAVTVLGAATAVSAQVGGKGDDASPPRYHEWAVRNGCDEPIRVAMRADGLVWGWQWLPPGQQQGFKSADTTIGIHARIGSGGSWWAQAGHPWLEHTVDLDHDFAYRVGLPAAGTPVTFLFFDILRQPLVTVCGP